MPRTQLHIADPLGSCPSRIDPKTEVHEAAAGACANIRSISASWVAVHTGA